ncbi:MAG: 6-carboxytetrahydropterin synthase [Planctomycetales bacterium]|nr:6-carboxytetrahydropterin synthase [Planctomycetales bacterium]
MIIQKEYKFYAAHRNETLMDKCSNLHGHRYGLRCFFEVERDGDISTLFGAFDEKVEPWLKSLYDHGMLINIHDPLYETLKDHCRRTSENFKMKLFNGPTSVENLAWMMFTEITEMGFRLSHIEVRETDSSVISYSREDWIRDNRYFASVRSPGVPSTIAVDNPNRVLGEN